MDDDDYDKELFGDRERQHLRSRVSLHQGSFVAVWLMMLFT